MNCSQIQDLLALFVYGDLDHDKAADVQAHLSQCDTCKSNFDELSQVREILNAAPAHNVIVDVDRISADTGLLPRTNRAVPWKKIALVATAAAILVACMFSFEIRIDQHQLILRWGNSSAQQDREAAISSVKESGVVREQRSAVSKNQDSEKLVERIRVLDDLVHALADEVESFDRRQNDSRAALQKRLGVLEQNARAYRAESNRSLAALYTAYFQNAPQGENQ